MLPPLLSGNLCSLREQVHRFSVSCLWEMTPPQEGGEDEGGGGCEIVDSQTWFGRTIIESVASMTYMQVQC
jgi:exoribonuclease R